jgi:hypothetical protein
MRQLLNWSFVHEEVERVSAEMLVKVFHAVEGGQHFEQKMWVALFVR